jgi:hypothetical protein
MRFYILFALIAFAAFTKAQNSNINSLNIQFSLRKVDGTPASNKSIRVKTILLTDPNNPNFLFDKVYTNLQTNAFGILNLEISGSDNSNRPFPSPEQFSANAIYLNVKVDTVDVSSTSSQGLFDIYATQKLSSVPYASAAGKAPGTLVYFNNTTLNNSNGVDGDAAIVYESNTPNFFPKIYFNKQNSTWPSQSHSLLPNDDSNIYRTIFYRKNTSNNNFWDINRALIMNDKGLGINLPSGITPSASLEVHGGLRFDTLRHNDLLGKMIIVDTSGSLQTKDLPTIDNILPFANNGDMLYFNGISNSWQSTPLMKFRINRMILSNSLTVGDTVRTDHAIVGNSMQLSTLTNPAPLDSTRFLTTDVNGTVKLHKVKFPSTSGSLPNGTQQGDFLFYNLPTASWQNTSKVQFRNSSSLYAVADTSSVIAATFENTFSSNSQFQRPIALLSRANLNSYGIGIDVLGGRSFINRVFAGKGITTTGAIGISATTNVIGGAGTTGAVAGHFYTNLGQTKSVAVLAESFSANGAAIIVNQGHSGFGIPYIDGSSSDQFPNSTVEINGTFGMKAQVIRSVVSSAMFYTLADASSVYIHNSNTASPQRNVTITLPSAASVLNREYSVMIFVENNANITINTSGNAELVDFASSTAFSAPLLNKVISNNGSTEGYKLKFVSVNLNSNSNPDYKWLFTQEPLKN